MRKAITLAEVMFAAVVTVVVLCSLLLQFVSGAYLNESSRMLTRAISHAQYIMEDIKNTDFPDIKSKIENGDWDWNYSDILSHGIYAMAAEAIDTQVSGTSLLNITVIVTWQERGGRSRTTSLKTLISEP